MLKEGEDGEVELEEADDEEEEEKDEEEADREAEEEVEEEEDEEDNKVEDDEEDDNKVEEEEKDETQYIKIPSLKYRRLPSDRLEHLIMKDSLSCLTLNETHLILGTHWGFIHVLDFEGKHYKSNQCHGASVNDLNVGGEKNDWIISGGGDGKYTNNLLF